MIWLTKTRQSLLYQGQEFRVRAQALHVWSPHTQTQTHRHTQTNTHILGVSTRCLPCAQLTCILIPNTQYDHLSPVRSDPWAQSQECSQSTNGGGDNTHKKLFLQESWTCVSEKWKWGSWMHCKALFLKWALERAHISASESNNILETSPCPMTSEWKTSEQEPRLDSYPVCEWVGTDLMTKYTTQAISVRELTTTKCSEQCQTKHIGLFINI